MKLTTKTETVTKLVEVKEQVKTGVVLELTNEEAAILRILLGRCNNTNYYASEVLENITEGLRRVGYLAGRTSSIIDTANIFPDIRSIADLTFPK